MRSNVRLLMLAMLLTACSKNDSQMLGTLEWDHISIPAPESEQILEVAVSEGDSVLKGQMLLKLDSAHSAARLAKAQSAVQSAYQNLAEVKAGARIESVREAGNVLDAAKADASFAQAQLIRNQDLAKKQYIARSELDKSLAAARTANAKVRAAEASLELLQNGNRKEQILQAEAQLNSSLAMLDSTRIDADRITVLAPRNGRIDSLPFKQGDKPAAGSVLAILLVGSSPIARIYVPAPLRNKVHAGTQVIVRVNGLQTDFPGTVRSIRTEASFTPYYALTGKDASRLSYLAEVKLNAGSADLPGGVPVSVRFAEENAK